MLNNKKVIIIVNPPILTIGDLWIFLWLGKSIMLNFWPKFLTNGPIKNPNKEQTNMFIKIIPMIPIYTLSSAYL